jgi:hypothetical protein
MGRLAAATSPPEFKFKELRALVTTHVTYSQLPMAVRSHSLRLGEDRALYSVFVEVPNSSLRYIKSATLYHAELQIYGRVTDLTGRVLNEFEDSVQSEHNEERHLPALEQKSLYQKMLTLKSGTYKLELVLRDAESKQAGTAYERLAVPSAYPPGLSSSAILLASRIEFAPFVTSNLEQFVLGNLKVVPNVTTEFPLGDIAGIYMHVYGAAIDQSTGSPSLSVRYHVMQKGRSVRPPMVDDEGRSIRFASEQRAVLVHGIPTDGLAAGEYRLLVRIKDKISGMETTADANFKVK